MTASSLAPAIALHESRGARRRRRIYRALRAGAIVVAVVGVVSASLRTYVVASIRATPAPRRLELSAYDERALTALVAVSRLDTASDEYARIRGKIVGLSDKYVEHSWKTYAHMIPGILLLMLAPLQFNASLRRRRPRLHRWTGRFLLVMVLFSGGTAIYFGVVNPGIHPTIERPSLAMFSGLFLFAAARAFYAIRVRDIATHREWMIRMLAMALGIGTVRLVSIPVAFLSRARWESNFMFSMWLGWIITLAAAEFWIRHTRPAVARQAVPVQVTAT